MSSSLLQSRKRRNESCPSKVRADRPIVRATVTCSACTRDLPCYPLIVLSYKQNESIHDESPRHQQNRYTFTCTGCRRHLSANIIACQIHLDQTVIGPFSISDSILPSIPYQALLNTRSRNAGNLKSNQLMLLDYVNMYKKRRKVPHASCHNQFDKLVPGHAKINYRRQNSGILPQLLYDHDIVKSLGRMPGLLYQKRHLVQNIASQIIQIHRPLQHPNSLWSC